MARELSSVGTVSYNGYTFPAPFNAEVVAIPRRDSANRLIKYIVYTITITTTIVPDDAPKSTAGGLVDNNLENIRCRLLKAGGALKFIGQGFGTDFVVNDASSYTDPDSSNGVASYKVDSQYGPFPTFLRWRPVGTNRACEIIWTVEVTIPDCCQQENSGFLVNRLLEFNYTVSWDVDSEGVTTRIIQGRYETPGFRVGATSGLIGGSANGARPIQTAENYWPKVYASFLRPAGFAREFRRSYSQDKRTCDFVIKDSEIASDNPYFPYLVKMDVRQTTSLGVTGLPGGKIINSLSGSVTLAPKAPRHLGWLAFANIARARFGASKGLTYTTTGIQSEKQQVSFPIATHLSLEEEIYSRRFHFSLDWFYAGSLETMFTGSGLFRPVGVNNQGQLLSWTPWTQSMTETAQSVRSLANMQHKVTDDILIAACDAQSHPSVNGDSTKYYCADPFVQPEQKEAVPPQSSWVVYNLTISPVQETNTIKHRPVSNVSPQSQQPGNSSDPHSTSYKIDSNTSESQKVKDHIQVRGNATYRITITGFAMRIGYPIPIPVVKSIGGVTPTVVDVKSVQGDAGKTAAGHVIFTHLFRITLDFDDIPKGDLYKTLVTQDALPEQHT